MALNRRIDSVAELERHDFGFRDLPRTTDTTSPGGELFLNILDALAEFERSSAR